MIGLSYGEKNYDDMLSRFHLIPKRYGRTDRRTDRFAISISRVNMLTRDENGITCGKDSMRWSHAHFRLAEILLHCDTTIHIFRFFNDLRFLSRVSILTCDIDIANLSACLSVCLSVRNVPIKTA